MPTRAGLSAGSRAFRAAKLRRCRILVADDELAVRDALRRVLEAEGYEVLFAPDGPETLDAFASSRPDAAVLDVMMPPPDGLEVCRRLRARGNATPILLLTAQTRRLRPRRRPRRRRRRLPPEAVRASTSCSRACARSSGARRPPRERARRTPTSSLDTSSHKAVARGASRSS